MNDLNIAVELIAETSISVDDSTYFKMHLERNGTVIAASPGIDSWGLNTMVIPGKRIAAIGRHAKYTVADTSTGIGFGPIQARESTPCSLELEAYDTLTVCVENNAVLDPGLFCMDFSLAVRLNDHIHPRLLDISLRRPDISMNWPSRGVFRFDITKALS